MTDKLIVSQYSALRSRFWAFGRKKMKSRPDIHTLCQYPKRLPSFVAANTTAQRILNLIGPLNWGCFPERDLERNWGQAAIPYAAFAAAYLIKLNEGLVSMSSLRQYLVENPSLIWLLGFPLVASGKHPAGFDPDASLPTQRHLSQMLRSIPNAGLQFLLTDSVRMILEELSVHSVSAGDSISLDTKHILAWVRENNPKQYVENRYDKNRQAQGRPGLQAGM